MSLLTLIGIKNLLYLILINENILPAHILRFIDYKDLNTFNNTLKHNINNRALRISNNSVKNLYLNIQDIKLIVETIKITFPQLHISYDYTPFYGLIISKKNYNGQINITQNRLKQILGYTCNTIISDNINIFRHTIYFTIGKIKYQFYRELCNNVDAAKKWHKIISNIKLILKNKKYINVLENINISDIYIETIEYSTIDNLIKNVINNKLSDVDIYTLYSIFMKLFYACGIHFILKFIEHFQFSNLVHRGILLELLVANQYDELQYPLSESQYGKEIIITKNWTIDIINSIKKTKISNNISSKEKYNTKKLNLLFEIYIM